jgi:hypothetical protein
VKSSKVISATPLKTKINPTRTFRNNFTITDSGFSLLKEALNLVARLGSDCPGSTTEFKAWHEKSPELAARFRIQFPWVPATQETNQIILSEKDVFNRHTLPTNRKTRI